MSTPVEPSAGREASLVGVLSSRARERPADLAYAFLSEDGELAGRLSYGDLDRGARAVAAAASERARPGDRAVLLYPPGLDFIVAFFACLRAGIVAVPVPCDPERALRTRRGLRAVLRDARPRLILTASRLEPFLDELGESAAELRSICRLATDGVALELAGDWQQREVLLQTVAYLQYTSGSTSAPRGVEIRHRNLLANSASIRDAWGYGADSVAVMWVPHFHDDGLVHGIVQPLFGGFPSYLMAARDFVRRPARWLGAISRWRATHSGGPNFAYALSAAKVSEEERAELDLGSWRVAYNAAEPIHPETLDRFVTAFRPRGFRREAFFPSYGLAEATLLVSTKAQGAAPVLRAVDREELERSGRVRAVAGGAPEAKTVVGCGRVVAGTEVAIVDPETGGRREADRVGEVWIVGPGVAEGYWRNPAATAETFGGTPAGGGRFLRTGDLGFLRDGELFITGRLKDLIILRGRNHYPQDVELTVAGCHPALRPGCGAAFAVERDGEEKLVVVQEVDDRQPVDAREIVDEVTRAVAEGHELALDTLVLVRPRTILKTSSGKIQRRACRAALEAGELVEVARWTASPRAGQGEAPAPPAVTPPDATSPAARRTARDVEDWLIAWTAAETGVAAAEIELDRSFASLGLDSVTGVWLVGDLQNWLGRAVDATLVWDYPTIATMAAHLASEEGD